MVEKGIQNLYSTIYTLSRALFYSTTPRHYKDSVAIAIRSLKDRFVTIVSLTLVLI